MPEKAEHKEVPQKQQNCPTVGSQTATVCLPVKVNPFSVAGPPKIECCGEPRVMPACDHCHGKINGACEFTISQKIRVEIPVQFGATVDLGNTYVDCERAKGEKDEHGCGCKCDDDD